MNLYHNRSLMLEFFGGSLVKDEKGLSRKKKVFEKVLRGSKDVSYIESYYKELLKFSNDDSPMVKSYYKEFNDFTSKRNYDYFYSMGLSYLNEFVNFISKAVRFHGELEEKYGNLAYKNSENRNYFFKLSQLNADLGRVYRMLHERLLTAFEVEFGVKRSKFSRIIYRHKKETKEQKKSNYENLKRNILAIIKKTEGKDVLDVSGAITTELNKYKDERVGKLIIKAIKELEKESKIQLNSNDTFTVFESAIKMPRLTKIFEQNLREQRLNDRQQAIVDYVADNPGSSIVDVMNGVDVSYGRSGHRFFYAAVNRLISNGTLEGKREGTRVKLYVKNS